MWSFARAGTVFTSHALYGGQSSPPNQQLVLFWHGEGVVKPVGLLDGDPPVHADVAPVCSQVGRAFRCAEFGLHPMQVPVLGAPRNDRMLSASRDDVRKRMGWTEQPRWLWLPTYRSAVRGGLRTDVSSPNGLPFDDDALRRLDRGLAERGISVILKPHPLSDQSLPADLEHLQILGQKQLDRSGVSLYELLGATDGLVTDVSSVWLDYLLTQRPIVFAFPDVDAYRSSRGINLEPYEEWVPGPMAMDVESLLAHLVSFTTGTDDYEARRGEMLRRFQRFTDAHSADRLLDAVNLRPVV